METSMPSENGDFSGHSCHSMAKLEVEATSSEIQRCAGEHRPVDNTFMEVANSHTQTCLDDPNIPNMSDSSTNSCCISKKGNQLSDSHRPSKPLKNVKCNAASVNTESVAIQIDSEGLLHSAKRVMLSVQGMSCTGCEKNLYRTLSSIPAISNIKISLLLGQAEFDLGESLSINRGNVAYVVEKKAGFVCSRITTMGEELDLIVRNNVLAIAKGWPTGVTDLIFVGKDRLRVSYLPRVIGARELLSDPFFQSARLAPHSIPPLIASGKAHLRHECLMTLIAAVFTVPVLILSYAPLPQRGILYGGICLGLATAVQTVAGGPFYPRAFKSLINSRLVEMDMLVVLSTTTAYIYSVIAYSFMVAGKPLSTPGFFETSTLLVTLIMVGRSVSAYARQKAVESISIESKQEQIAVIIGPENKEELEIDARLLQYGDTFKVFPEASVVTDGVVVQGESEVDESLVTGEATLISKKFGSSVIAGSVNHSGTLLVQLTRLPCENTIKSIRAMVDEAKSSKPKVQEISDSVAGYFVPVILILTVVVFTIWVAVGISVRHETKATACINAMTYAISVLIVSCPCAIGLAVPMVVVIAGGVAAKHGIILKSAETIEIGRKVSHVIFDKTGTLTQGRLSVVAENYWDLAYGSSSVSSIILKLTSNSKHPVSTAIAAHLKTKARNYEASHIEGLVSIPGSGIEAIYNGAVVRAGNPYWLNVQDKPAIYELLRRGLTIYCVTISAELVAVFGLQDSLRPDAESTISVLKDRCIAISLISGDNEAAVNLTARQLGIPNSYTRSRCSPTDKQTYVKSLLASENAILFCGDGTNDAVALAQASIGMHINSGTDVAQSAADVVLMRPSLKGIITLIDLSKAFHKRVVFNFAWAFIYNIVAILLAAGALPRARIPPQYAGLGEVCSVLPVIAVAMGLRLKKFWG